MCVPPNSLGENEIRPPKVQAGSGGFLGQLMFVIYLKTLKGTPETARCGYKSDET